MKAQRESKHQKNIVQARQEVVHRLTRVRDSIDRELSWYPKGQKWLLPLMAFATGAAMASGSRKSKKKRPKKTD